MMGASWFMHLPFGGRIMSCSSTSCRYMRAIDRCRALEAARCLENLVCRWLRFPFFFAPYFTMLRSSMRGSLLLADGAVKNFLRVQRWQPCRALFHVESALHDMRRVRECWSHLPRWSFSSPLLKSPIARDIRQACLSPSPSGLGAFQVSTANPWGAEVAESPIEMLSG